MNGTNDIRLTAFFLALFLLKQNIPVFLTLNYEESQFKWVSSRS
jgi:hypothetical protein